MMNYRIANLLLDTKAPFLIHPYSEEHSLNQFLLRKPNESPCQLPLTYLNIVRGVKGAQIESDCVTKFYDQAQKTRCPSIDSSKKCTECEAAELRCYCVGDRIVNLLGDQSLYEWLEGNNLFGEDPNAISWSYKSNWKPIPIMEK